MRDFSELLHELRGRELERLPAGARTVLHGGAAGAWYFEWFDERYPGTVERHVGVEAFAPRPEDLPLHVDWLERTLGDMGPVADGSIDMVFGGQVIEHLWPDDVAGLLLESHRVLRPDGRLVLDSPNRRVTEAIAWQHPEHTVEFSVEEAVALVGLAGFDVEAVRGVLLGYDRAGHRFLGIDTSDAGPPTWDERETAAAACPEDAFIWWLVASRAARAPDVDALRGRANECFESFRAARFRSLRTPLPLVHEAGSPPRVSAEAAYGGLLVHGPYVPVDAGAWRATFALRAGPNSIGADAPIATLDVTSGAGEVVHARREVRLGEVAADGAWTGVPLDFRLEEMTMGIELRAFSLGGCPFELRLSIELDRGRVSPPSKGPRSRMREGRRILRRWAPGRARR